MEKVPGHDTSSKPGRKKRGNKKRCHHKQEEENRRFQNSFVRVFVLLARGKVLFCFTFSFLLTSHICLNVALLLLRPSSTHLSQKTSFSLVYISLRRVLFAMTSEAAAVAI